MQETQEVQQHKLYIAPITVYPATAGMHAPLQLLCHVELLRPIHVMPAAAAKHKHTSVQYMLCFVTHLICGQQGYAPTGVCWCVL